MNLGLDKRLTVISTPAGYGKTTLLADWIHTEKEGALKNFRVAWLALDSYDNNPERFLGYLITALQQVDENIGSSALKMKTMIEKVPLNDLLISVLNDVYTRPYNLLFVVDDYHFIREKSIHRQVSFMLDRLPENVHVLISTREDPLEFLSRMRARDQVNELRKSDLSFSRQEIRNFIEKFIFVDLSDPDLDVLEQSTEGWIAALQLAVSVIKNQQKMIRVADAFSSSHPVIMDYLLEEIFNQQDNKIRAFLLKTSILERFSSDLCNELTDRNDSSEILNYLEHNNLLLEPLDNSHTWYRYHNIFSEFLYSRLQGICSAEIPILNQKASRWFYQNGYENEAILYALKGNDYQFAVQLMEGLIQNPITQIGTTTIISWLKMLPSNIVQNNPRLLLWFAWSNLLIGNTSVLKSYLDRAENILLSIKTEEGGEPSIDGKQGPSYRKMWGELETLNSYLAYYEENFEETIAHSQKALEWFGKKHPDMQGHARSLQGYAYLLQLDYRNAIRSYQDAYYLCSATGEKFITWLLQEYISRLQYGLGDLQKSEQTLQKILKVIPGEPPYHLLQAKAFTDYGEILRERNELAASRDYLNKGILILEKESCSPFLGDAYISKISLDMALQDWEDAWKSLHKAKNLALSLEHSKFYLQVEAYQTWIQIKQGETFIIDGWINKYREQLFKEMGFSVEFPQYVYIRSILAQYRKGEINRDALLDCMLLIERLLQVAKETARIRSSVTLWVLLSQVLCELKRMPEAMRTIHLALESAEKQGFVRLFLDEEEPFKLLLSEAFNQGICPGFSSKLLLMSETENVEADEVPLQQKINELLVEPLSPREMEVLNLLITRATNKEIASCFSIEISTVKSHVSSILRKLDVQSRRQAIEKVKKMGMLSEN